MATVQPIVEHTDSFVQRDYSPAAKRALARKPALFINNEWVSSSHRATLIVECGDAREVHHYCLLIGYGASAINPYLAFETLDDMIRQNILQNMDHRKAVNYYIKAYNMRVQVKKAKGYDVVLVAAGRVAPLGGQASAGRGCRGVPLGLPEVH